MSAHSNSILLGAAKGMITEMIRAASAEGAGDDGSAVSKNFNAQAIIRKLPGKSLGTESPSAGAGIAFNQAPEWVFSGTAVEPDPYQC